MSAKSSGNSVARVKNVVETSLSAASFDIFGKKLNVAVERVEYNMLRARFKALADAQYKEAESTIDEAADSVDDFCNNGNEWAHQYLDKAADLAVEILMEKGCYDVDSKTFVIKYLNTYLWDKKFKVLCEGVAEIDAEEEEREGARQERSARAGNWVGFNEAGERAAREKNLNENVTQGALNLLGRGFYMVTNANRKRSLYEKNRDDLLNAIYLTIKTSVDELLDCLEAVGKPLQGAKVSKEAREKAERLFNNLQTGKLALEVALGTKMQILELNPYNRKFYEYVYVNEGDKTGELCTVSEFFGISLDDLKAEAFTKQLGKCAYETEEETIEYRKRAVELGKEIRFEPTDKLAEIDAKLKVFDEKARTVDGKLFDTREEAALQRQLSEFEKTLDLSTEEAAIASRKLLEAKIAELGIDGEWKYKRVDKSLKKFDELARTTFGILLESREAARQALGNREIFFKGIEATVKMTGEDSFYTSETIPEKKISNARAKFPIPVDEYVLALTDTTLFGSGKTGLAITKWGLRWENKSSPSNVKSVSWEDFANRPMPPVDADNDFTLIEGGLYSNGGSGVDEEKMKIFLEKLWGYCRAATFFVKKTAEELASEEAGLTFRQKMDRLLMSITDSGFYVGSRIPEKKLRNASKACMVDSGDEILALIDSTLFGSAATALLVCEKGVYWHNKESSGKCFIAWEKMSSYKSTMSVSDDTRLVFSQGNSFYAGMASVDLEKLKNVFIQIGDLATAR